MGEWRYLWNRKVRHYIETTLDRPITDNSMAICTVLPTWFSVGGWYGIGTQEERDHIRTLRPCRSCVRRGAPDGPMKDD